MIRLRIHFWALVPHFWTWKWHTSTPLQYVCCIWSASYTLQYINLYVKETCTTQGNKLQYTVWTNSIHYENNTTSELRITSTATLSPRLVKVKRSWSGARTIQCVNFLKSSVLYFTLISNTICSSAVDFGKQEISFQRATTSFACKHTPTLPQLM